MVDADPQRSSLRWSQTAPDGFPFPVVDLPSKSLHRVVPGLAGDHNVVVIDTPPREDAAGIVASALRLATHVVVPLDAGPEEYDRLPAIREFVEDSAAFRASGEPPEMVALLTRVIANASATAVYRELMEEAGVRVLRGTVRRLERFHHAIGQNVISASATAYGDAVDELLVRDRVAR